MMSKVFTVLELLIATAVFSLVLVIFLTAVINISQTFYKGISLSNTQEAARNAVQTIADDIQFYGDGPDLTYLDSNNSFCIGDHRYTFVPGKQIGSGGGNDYGLVREIKSPCTAPTGADVVNPLTAEKLLDPGMQINGLHIKHIDVDARNNSAYTIDLSVVFYGSDKGVFFSPTATSNDPNSGSYDAYLKPDARCTGAQSSSQLCASINYQTTILQKW